ncbi:MAG: UvrD-helicase domain-containing protein [Planctomycetota bacterium]|nr:UvrD-helicase domain-containing protein [Planctomycetota bacterium]
MDFDHLLDDLTPPQKEAATHTEGPLLILAAAGSGKTRVITRRIANLIGCGVPPWSILALTFTNKAAGEMRERVHTMLDPQGDDPRLTRGLTVSTFHALCARLLRRYAELAEHDGVKLGIKPDFTIYPAADQLAAIKAAVLALGLSTSNWPPRSVLSAISAAKNELLDAEAFSLRASDFYAKNIAKLYSSYQAKLRAANAADFDDLLVLTAKMLRDSPAVREECQKRWQYLMIDEYQDTNHAQFVIASLLAGDGPEGGIGPNVCVVGDPDQAIYSWRGADITNILEFEERYPAASVITLGENFRSTAPILAAADALIRNNKQRKHKDLYTSREGGDPVTVVLCRDERHEAQLVTDWLRSHAEDEDGEGARWREMAVFYRTNALSRVMEDALREAGVPYVIARGTAFFDREEIKHALGYLRVVANPADDVSLGRIVNTPARGIGATSLGRVREMAQTTGLTLWEALGRVEDVPGLSARATNAVRTFVETVRGWTGGGAFMGREVSGSLAELVERVVRESGLERMYTKQAQTSKSESDAERLDNLSELVSSAAQFEEDYDPASDPFAFPAGDSFAPAADPQADAADATTDPATTNTNNNPAEQAETPPLLAMLRAYLEKVSLVADADAIDPAQGSVTLMTLHAAKGLEFPVVAMIGLEEGLLPHSRAQTSESDLEEERRLCFVGITRAMEHVQLTSAKYRTIRGMTERTIPSRFIEELPREHAKVSDQSDAWADTSDSLHNDASDGFDAGPTDGHSRSGSAYETKPGGKLAQARRELPVGSKVRHPQFGVGEVLSLDGGASVRAKIKFKHVGVKTLVLEYARLQRLP